MAYDHQQIEHRVAAAHNIAGTAAIGALNPGYQPYRLRAVAVVITTTFTTDPSVVTAIHRPGGPGVTSGQETIASLTIPVGAAAGEVHYTDDIAGVVVRPGESLHLASNTGSAAGAGDVILFIEPVWDSPDSNENMIDSTTP